MTVRRALIGAWAVLSLCWVGFWSWHYHVISCGPTHAGESFSIGWHCDGPVLAGGDYEIVPIVVILASIIGIPLAILFAGIALRLIAIHLDRPQTPERDQLPKR
jgi:hypothetical protein